MAKRPKRDGRGEISADGPSVEGGVLGAPEIFEHVEERRRLPVNDYARSVGTIQVWRDV